MLTKNFARIWGMYCVGAPNNVAMTTLRLVSNKNEIFNNDLFQSAGFYILRNENLVLNEIIFEKKKLFFFFRRKKQYFIHI